MEYFICLACVTDFRSTKDSSEYPKQKQGVCIEAEDDSLHVDLF